MQKATYSDSEHFLVGLGRLLGLAGQDYPYRPLGKWLQTVSAPTLNVRLSPARNDMQLYLRATDETGRPIGYSEMGLAGVVYSWQPPDLFQMFPPDSHRSTFVANRTLYTASAQPIDNVVNFNLTIPSGVKRITERCISSLTSWIHAEVDAALALLQENLRHLV